MLFNFSKKSWDAKLESYFSFDLEVNRDYDFDSSILNLNSIVTNGLVAQFDTNKINSWNGFEFKSLKTWTGSTLSAFTINDIGLTGIDSNLVPNFSGQTLVFSTGTTLTLNPIFPHPYYKSVQSTGKIVTQYDFTGLSIGMKDSIIQGNFKLDGFPHQTLPVRNERGFTYDFWISFKNDETIITTGETLNSIYPNNEGIFFYMGVKSANKFENKLNSETGLTTSTNISLFNEKESTGNTYSGLAFIFKDNKISYKTLIPLLNDNDELYHKTFTGETKYDIFTGNKESSWINLTIKFERNISIDPNDCIDTKIPCDCCIPNDRKGKLFIYVNGRPVHVFKDWVEPIFHKLNTDSTKQELVPYTISLGGGTQGLEYNLTLDENGDLVKDTNDNKIIEENFAGTFSGSISQFNIYDKPLSVSEVIHNFKINKDRYRRRENFGGNNILINYPFIVNAIRV